MHTPALPRARGRRRPRGHPRGNKLTWLVEHRAQILASIAVTALVVGGLLYAVGEGAAGQQVWRATVALLAAELAVEVGRSVVVEHGLGVDTIALVAMVGALALKQELAGVVIGLMFSGGASLEAVASRRARRELTALVQRAPRVAQLRVGRLPARGARGAGAGGRHGAGPHRRGHPRGWDDPQRRGRHRHEHAHGRAAA